MSEVEEQEKLGHEERLKAIAYQFVLLYERWSEDRQVAVKQGADMAELVKLFTKQVKHFHGLEESVRKEIIESIHHATTKTANGIGDSVGRAASSAIQGTVSQLSIAVNRADDVLNTYQTELVKTHWKIILSTVAATVIVCFSIFAFLMPKPTLPLTNKQIKQLESGMAMDLVWPKLSKQEQQHWQKLADEVFSPGGDS